MLFNPTFFFTSLSCVVLCVGTCMCVNKYAVWRPEVNIKRLPGPVSTLFRDRISQ